MDSDISGWPLQTISKRSAMVLPIWDTSSIPCAAICLTRSTSSCAHVTSTCEACSANRASVLATGSVESEKTSALTPMPLAKAASANATAMPPSEMSRAECKNLSLANRVRHLCNAASPASESAGGIPQKSPRICFAYSEEPNSVRFGVCIIGRISSTALPNR